MNQLTKEADRQNDVLPVTRSGLNEQFFRAIREQKCCKEFKHYCKFA